MSKDKRVVKVFQLNSCEWFAGYDLESVKREYLDQIGMDAPEDGTFENPHELSDAEMDTLKYKEDPSDSGGETITFREQLARVVASEPDFPVYFAGTEL